MTDNKSILLQETAKIRWHELQLWFAKGLVLQVAKDEDLIDVASLLANDAVNAVEKLLDDQQLVQVDADQASEWFNADAVLWAVVVKPWVLVQES